MAVELVKSKCVTLDAKEESLFDEKSEYLSKNYGFPKKIHFRQGEAIDAVQLEYEGGTLPLHGTEDGGHPIHFALADGEYITRITGTSKTSYWNNRFILSLVFHTNKNHAFGLHDTHKGVPKEGIPFEIEFPDHMALACLYGGIAHPIELKSGVVRDKLLLSAIGAYARRYE